MVVHFILLFSVIFPPTPKALYHNSARKSALNFIQAEINSSAHETNQLVLADVQDRLDTVDQAGLYVLLERTLQTKPSEREDAQRIDPGLLLAQPAKWRGALLSYPAQLNRRFLAINVSRNRPVGCEKTGYITAKITWENGLAYPAIILLTEPVEPVVDRGVVQGYFYMILRSKTQKPPDQAGPEVLDYLVFVTDRLVPWQTSPTGRRAEEGWPFWWNGLGLLLLALVWVWLKWKIRIRSNRLIF